MDIQRPCLQYCVDAYVQVVRFQGSDAAKKNEEMRKALEKAVAEAGAQGVKRVPQGLGLGKDTGFDYITGDIPALVDTAEGRMTAALLRMGNTIIPYLQDAALKANNPQVTKALKLLYDLILTSGRKPVRLVPPAKPAPEKPAPVPLKEGTKPEAKPETPAVEVE